MCVVEEKYKLGIEIIDNQHQKIFDMIELLCQTIGEKDLIKIINELKQYSIYHFKTEEDYFKEIHFTKAVEHIKTHNIFIQTIDFYFEHPQKLNKMKLHTFLTTWIQEHILIDDKEYTKKENITI